MVFLCFTFMFSHQSFLFLRRDIKGANIMLMSNGIIKLIDFGCAKRLCLHLSVSQSEVLKSMKGLYLLV